MAVMWRIQHLPLQRVHCAERSRRLRPIMHTTSGVRTGRSRMRRRFLLLMFVMGFQQSVKQVVGRPERGPSEAEVLMMLQAGTSERAMHRYMVHAHETGDSSDCATHGVAYVMMHECRRDTKVCRGGESTRSSGDTPV